MIIGNEFILVSDATATPAMAHTRKSRDPIFSQVFIYEHCPPFNVSRAVDEASRIKNSCIWMAERDKAMSGGASELKRR